MKLARVQRLMARAVMQPLTPSERTSRVGPDGKPMRVYAARFIKPNDRLTSFERLEIYNRQYWFRILSSMDEDFPGLCSVLGDRGFERMSKAYLTDCPSQSFTLRNLGSRLEGWLRKNPRWAGKKQKLALDIIRLEWADIEVFDSAAEPPLRPEDLKECDPSQLRLRLQPYLRLLELSYPVDDLLLEVRRQNDEDTGFASNAMREQHKRKRVRAVAKLKPARIFLVVHRVDGDVYFRRIEKDEFVILSELRSGKPLEKAIQTALRKSSAGGEAIAATVQQWFYNWATLGWFCKGS